MIGVVVMVMVICMMMRCTAVEVVHRLISRAIPTATVGDWRWHKVRIIAVVSHSLVSENNADNDKNDEDGNRDGKDPGAKHCDWLTWCFRIVWILSCVVRTVDWPLPTCG